MPAGPWRERKAERDLEGPYIHRNGELPMETVAPGVYSAPVGVSHVYAIADGAILVDTGMAKDRSRVLAFVRAVLPQGPRLICITHGDVDHIGSVLAIRQELGGKIMSSSVEQPYLERRERYPGLKGLIPRGRPVQPDLTLEDGDRVGDFRVVATPGHTPGHISLFRAADGLLIAGDACQTRRGRLRPSPALLATDEAKARASFAKLMGLMPRVVLPGHGAPIRT